MESKEKTTTEEEKRGRLNNQTNYGEGGKGGKSITPKKKEKGRRNRGPGRANWIPHSNEGSKSQGTNGGKEEESGILGKKK